MVAGCCYLRQIVAWPSITAPLIVLVSCAWMIYVEFFVQVPVGTMIGTVLRSAVETLLVSAFVSSTEIPVNLPVLRVITGVAVVVVMRECGCDRCGKQQHCCRHKSFVYEHDTSPLSKCLALQELRD